jgi:hypothetical protein
MRDGCRQYHFNSSAAGRSVLAFAAYTLAEIDHLIHERCNFVLPMLYA